MLLVNQPNFAFIFIRTRYCTDLYATIVRIRSFIDLIQRLGHSFFCIFENSGKNSGQAF